MRCSLQSSSSSSPRPTNHLVLECVSVVHLHGISIIFERDGGRFASCKCTIWYAPEKLKVFSLLSLGLWDSFRSVSASVEVTREEMDSYGILILTHRAHDTSLLTHAVKLVSAQHVVVVVFACAPDAL